MPGLSWCVGGFPAFPFEQVLGPFLIGHLVLISGYSAYTHVQFHDFFFPLLDKPTGFPGNFFFLGSLKARDSIGAIAVLILPYAANLTIKSLPGDDRAFPFV